MNINNLGLMPCVTNSYIIRTNKLMVVPDPDNAYEVKRPWKKRLFSRPWKPLKATNTIIPNKPDGKVIIFHNELIMHPATAEELKKLHGITI